MANSGAQVPKAAIVSAITILGTRKRVASELAESTKMSLAFTSAKSETKSSVMYRRGRRYLYVVFANE